MTRRNHTRLRRRLTRRNHTRLGTRLSTWLRRRLTRRLHTRLGTRYTCRLTCRIKTYSPSSQRIRISRTVYTLTRTVAWLIGTATTDHACCHSRRCSMITRITVNAVRIVRLRGERSVHRFTLGTIYTLSIILSSGILSTHTTCACCGFVGPSASAITSFTHTPILFTCTILSRRDRGVLCATCDARTFCGLIWSTRRVLKLGCCTCYTRSGRGDVLLIVSIRTQSTTTSACSSII